MSDQQLGTPACEWVDMVMARLSTSEQKIQHLEAENLRLNHLLDARCPPLPEPTPPFKLAQPDPIHSVFFSLELDGLPEDFSARSFTEPLVRVLEPQVSGGFEVTVGADRSAEWHPGYVA